MFGFERCCFEFDNHIGVQLDIVENEVDSKCFCCATKAKPLPQSQPASAKLGYSFEELCFWCFDFESTEGLSSRSRRFQGGEPMSDEPLGHIDLKSAKAFRL